jgi:hypothetical protein
MKFTWNKTYFDFCMLVSLVCEAIYYIQTVKMIHFSLP